MGAGQRNHVRNVRLRVGCPPAQQKHPVKAPGVLKVCRPGLNLGRDGRQHSAERGFQMPFACGQGRNNRREHAATQAR